MTRAKRHVFHGTALVLAMLLTACSSTKELIVLLPGEDGETGAVAIGDGDRAILLDEPLAVAKINARGRVKKGRVSEAEVEQIFAEALSAQPAEPVSFILYFETGGTGVAADSQAALDALFAEVASRKAVEVQITGHTDRVGQAANNDQLSLERAQAVRGMLMQSGLQSSFIRAVGRGEREPLVPTPDEQPEPRNRRVEVIVR